MSYPGTLLVKAALVLGMFYRTSYLAQMNLRQPHPKKTKQNTHIFVFVTQFVLCLQNGSERQQCGHGTSEGVLCCIMIGCWQQMFWAQWIRLALGYLCVLNHPPECLSQVTINTIAMVFWIHNAIICCLSLKTNEVFIYSVYAGAYTE